MQKILITGGLGYIGSHISLSLLESGYKVIVLDSFVNCNSQIEEKIIQIMDLKKFSNRDNFKVIKCDLCDEKGLSNILIKHSMHSKIDAVIHLAGLKAVDESINKPIKYWSNNVKGTINLLNIMDYIKCRKIVFSSSATIYGNVENKYLIKEESKIQPINTYGKTKQVIESILETLIINKKNNWNISILRYFNPIGAHQSGLIGEDPLFPPTNIMPIINKVALGKKEFLEIYGNDWNTRDGTCIRDYIHVVDLASGHLKALKCILDNKFQFEVLNLGTGKGFTVLELVKTFEKVNNIEIPFKFVERRLGDVPFSVADISKAKKITKWKPIYDLEEMCRDSWNWISKNA